jgi:hypothetical protein
VAHWAIEWGSLGECETAFAWSFYSQGTTDQSNASADLFLLRGVGRLAEALEPMRVSGEMDVEKERWIGIDNLEAGQRVIEIR